MTEQLVDRFGRVHRDLRISLTDRCSLRCTYCMPADGVPWLARSTMLSTEEIVHVARVGVDLGITEIRLTGGEPLLRVDIVDVVRRLTALSGPAGSPEVSLTTNALRLPGLASDLVDAGLSRVNISLDTLERAKFLQLTRRDKLVETLAGIAAADAAGLHPVKINAVAMRGVNDDEVVALTRFAVERGYQMRFIEQMPLDAGHTWDRAEMVTQAEILARLRAVFRLEEVPGRGAAPAELWTVDGGPATVGVIASVTAPFCGACDRLRLTADGQLRSCLFSQTETNVRDLLRGSGQPPAEVGVGPGQALRIGATAPERPVPVADVDLALAGAYRRCLAGKKAGHDIDDPAFLQPDRPMSAIGG
ncbi:GTP 3',8-cyclase MoaA [Cellulomonas fengjieae]|uniref:GTP 3',8-cyclase n=1 Tax=Cellulomonas fengjieae TaxID=2819978 RepID=A0ABS3SHT8_9CELL|nr:GTP 3',8-cyclase MoaA [Cellulomonas fengjieae]MBO3085317.1 GTP 3',8-cyclase MoaA [Cellulomonas fengjieae]QVI66125.1 GTP 3',8-cyclase MoaA [Cellulomonas fengjieae]